MKKSLILPVFFVFVGLIAAGQTTDESSKLQHAEKLRKGYQFNEAILLYKEILGESIDSLLRIRINSLITESENGINMLQYATRPTTKGKQPLHARDFFLYYPDSLYWATIPDSVSNYPNRLFSKNSALIREGAEVIYFSKFNKEGNWDIYHISQVDGEVWSSPEPLEGPVNSEGDELFPVISPDGKRLYFSSDGHFGMGGFDLYVSNWDEKMQSWEMPQNLGFPYSSVADDLLMIHSTDGMYTFFASNRENLSADSLTLYVLEFETNPVKRAVSSIEEAVELALLKIISAPGREKETRDVMTSPETEEYTKMILEVRKIQKDIDSLAKNIASYRNLYTTLQNEDDRILLERKIMQAELSMLDMQSLLRSANEVVQKREMDFLSKGTLIPRRDQFTEDTIVSDSVNEETIPLRTTKMEKRSFPSITLLAPITLFDYTFGVADESEMAEDQGFPDGLVYRIQLFAVVSQNKDLSAFKGLRPIFENRNNAGRYIYYAGQFYNYEEASKALAVARRSGFPSAIVTAFMDGKSLSINNARKMEQTLEASATYQVKAEGYPAGIPQPVLELIRNNTDKDIAKRVTEGRDIYIIGPYNTKQEAEQILNILLSIGAENVTVEEIPKN